MPRASVNFLPRMTQNKTPHERLAVLAAAREKARIGLFLVVVASIFMLLQQDAGAHSGSLHHRGMNGGQFHHPHFNNGEFHPGHFRHHGPRGIVILAPPLLSYSHPPAYFYPPVTAGQAAPVPFTEQASDGTTLSFWYYCTNPAGYYPNVQQCPSGWQVVQANSSY
jgi:hypothetical protein